MRPIRSNLINISVSLLFVSPGPIGCGEKERFISGEVRVTGEVSDNRRKEDGGDRRQRKTIEDDPRRQKPMDDGGTRCQVMVRSMRYRGMIGHYKSPEKGSGGNQPRGCYGVVRNGKEEKIKRKRTQPQKREIYENKKLIVELNLVLVYDASQCFKGVCDSRNRGEYPFTKKQNRD